MNNLETVKKAYKDFIGVGIHFHCAHNSHYSKFSDNSLNCQTIQTIDTNQNSLCILKIMVFNYSLNKYLTNSSG